MSKLDEDAAAEVCVRLAAMASNPRDAVHLIKMLAIACVSVVDELKEMDAATGAGVAEAAGWLLMSTTATIGVDLKWDRDTALRALAVAIDMLQATQRSTLVNAPGGVA